jgi:hypothetical protein
MIQDWISVFQLGAALSLVVGGYAGHRETREVELKELIAEAERQISALRQRDGRSVERNVPDGTLLDAMAWKDMSTTDLNDLRRDVTRRLFDKIGVYEGHDRVRQWGLWLNGIVSIAALIFASANVGVPMPTLLGVVISVVLLGMPFLAMATVWYEALVLRRETEPNDRKKGKERGRKATFRSRTRLGQSFHVFTEIRRRYRGGVTTSDPA